MRDDDPELAAIIETEVARDHDNAAREFFCDTSVGGGSGFFDAAAIANAIDETPLPLPVDRRLPTAAAADFAFRSDSSALVVARYDGRFYGVANLLELRPERGKPLAPSHVVARFAEVTKSYGLDHVIADGHYRESIHEHLLTHGLEIIDAPAGLNGKIETYSRARAVLHEGRAKLPNDPRFLAQLRAVTSRPMPGGGLSIVSPRRAGGGHGDLVSAWVLAVHRLAYAVASPPPRQLEADKWEELARDRRRQEAKQRSERPWWNRSQRVTGGRINGR
jgi:hypothetical protein